MYRAGLEGILGFRVQGASLLLDPCVPRSWPRFEIVFRYHSARYEITVENPQAVSRGVAEVEVDGTLLVGTPLRIPLLDDGAVHKVRMVLGYRENPPFDRSELRWHPSQNGLSRRVRV